MMAQRDRLGRWTTDDRRCRWINYSLSAAERHQLRAMARARGMTVTGMILVLLGDYMADCGRDATSTPGAALEGAADEARGGGRDGQQTRLHGPLRRVRVDMRATEDEYCAIVTWCAQRDTTPGGLLAAALAGGTTR